MSSAPHVAAGNRYTVVVRDEGTGRGAGQGMGWVVTIVDPDGREVSERACRDENEATTFASTVRQHAEWLSEERFREIYRIAEGA